MSNWYTSREAIKRSVPVLGNDRNQQIDRLIETKSREVDRETNRPDGAFYPVTETRLYRWPQPGLYDARRLWLDQSLIAVTTLQTQAQNTSPTTIASSDFFLEPNNSGPPFNRIEIDLSSTAAFEAGDTPQRSISVAGRWGFKEPTLSAGAVASGLSSSASDTAMVCSDGSLIDVGSTVLIESESVFISGRSFAALASILVNDGTGPLADMADTTIVVDGGTHAINDGELIRIDDEVMYVVSTTTTVLTVARAYDGTALATHANDTAIHIQRTLTIERGANGTTASTHADDTAISLYEVPFPIKSLVTQEVVAAYHQEQSGMGRVIGAGDQQREWSGDSLHMARKSVYGAYRRTRNTAV